MKTTFFVQPFARTSNDEETYRTAGTLPIRYTRPENIFDTAQGVEDAHRKSYEESLGGFDYEPAIVAEVDLLDPKMYPNPDFPTAVPYRILRLVE